MSKNTTEFRELYAQKPDFMDNKDDKVLSTDDYVAFLNEKKQKEDDFLLY